MEESYESMYISHGLLSPEEREKFLAEAKALNDAEERRLLHSADISGMGDSVDEQGMMLGLKTRETIDSLYLPQNKPAHKKERGRGVTRKYKADSKNKKAMRKASRKKNRR